MFYPQLVRRAQYSVKRCGSYYADYHHYYEEIKSDCLERCVYCDGLLSEHGYEGFHLDHFRPSSLFPGLSTDPNNLVLACSKCNIFKSKVWHSKIYFHVCASHDGISGFIDPFQDPLGQYFLVDATGSLVPQSAVADFMINLLHLNRASRLLIRRQRRILHRIRTLNLIVDQKLDALDKYMESDDFDRARARAMLADARAIKNSLTALTA